MNYKAKMEMIANHKGVFAIRTRSFGFVEEIEMPKANVIYRVDWHNADIWINEKGWLVAA